MSEIVIRTAELQDLERLLEFEQQIIGAERSFDPTIRNGPDVHYYDLRDLILSPDAEVIVATVDSKIVASGYARVETSERYLDHESHTYLGFMYVVDEYRGKGINKGIISALEDWSRARGIMELRLEVYAENTAAIKAYEKSGYSRLTLAMRKRLEP